jgi:hypothetical protein
MIVVGEGTASHREVANGRPFLEIPFGRGRNYGLETVAERAAFNHAIGGFQVETLRVKDLKRTVADDRFLPHRRHVDESVYAVRAGIEST